MSNYTAPERDESSRPRWQRLLVLVVSSKPGAALLRKVMHRIDRPLLRLTRGRVSFVSAYPVLLLTTTGARSGKQRTVPLLYVRCGSGFAIIGTRFGSTHHPGWYYNLRARPQATVEIDGTQHACVARAADEGEREEIWERAVRMYSGYERYAARTHRTIPMLILEPAPGSLQRLA
jgi:deazaflavin-dependent oxidoreductase (nitroreductase family)